MCHLPLQDPKTSRDAVTQVELMCRVETNDLRKEQPTQILPESSPIPSNKKLSTNVQIQSHHKSKGVNSGVERTKAIDRQVEVSRPAASQPPRPATRDEGAGPGPGSDPESVQARAGASGGCPAKLRMWYCSCADNMIQGAQ